MTTLALVVLAGVLAAASATYCLESMSAIRQYTYCNSGYRCCPGYGCCSVSASCCYAPLNQYSNGCCGYGTTCCTDAYNSNTMLCCSDSSEECCTDDYGNAKCCSLISDNTTVNEIMYAIAVVMFACLVGVLALCVHYRNREHLTRANRVQSPGLTFSNRAQPNDFDNFDMLPSYKERTPPPRYEDILQRMNEIDRACGAGSVQGRDEAGEGSRDADPTGDDMSWEPSDIIIVHTVEGHAQSPIYEIVDEPPLEAVYEAVNEPPLETEGSTTVSDEAEAAEHPADSNNIGRPNSSRIRAPSDTDPNFLDEGQVDGNGPGPSGEGTAI